MHTCENVDFSCIYTFCHAKNDESLCTTLLFPLFFQLLHSFYESFELHTRFDTQKTSPQEAKDSSGAKMLQIGSRELPCALAFSLVKNDDQGPKARRSISACRFLRVKTCVWHEKHVKTVQKCMPEAPEAYVLQIRFSAHTRCDVPYTLHNLSLIHI